MKIRIADRVLVALAGVLLLALCVGVVAQSFFDVPVLETVEGLLSGKKAVAWLPYVLCAALLALGGYCIALLFRRRRGKRGFVMQETDGGEVSIALKAMEGLVAQCVAVHEEMQLLASNITTDHDGVVVELRVALSRGVSIPLAVDALQKQIRQYVTSCSGVAVREVRVQVDSMDSQPVDSPYVVPAMLQSAVPAPLLIRGEEEAAEKPLHQRIFSDPKENAAPVEAVAADASEQPEGLEGGAEADSEADSESAAVETEQEAVAGLDEAPETDAEPDAEPAEASEMTDTEMNEAASDDADEDMGMLAEDAVTQPEEEADETAE